MWKVRKRLIRSYILQNYGVIHGAQFKITIWEDLLAQFLCQYSRPLFNHISILYLQKKASKINALALARGGSRMHSIFRCNNRACTTSSERIHQEGVIGETPFNPIDNAQRCWIRLPTSAFPRRAICNPITHQINV